MGILQDLDSTIRSYVADNVNLDVVDVTKPGTSINVEEVCGFQARVSNNGLLKMADVSLQIDGLNGTLVSTSATGPWSSSITVNSLNVPARAVRDTGNLHFKAPTSPQPAFTTLVNVRVKNWKADLTPLLEGSSVGEENKVGHLMAQVFPS
jgi:hypothetical protein